MIQANGNTLIITIAATDPNETCQQLIQDISAAVRWYASSDALQNTDKDALYRLAQLQAQLTTKE